MAIIVGVSALCRRIRIPGVVGLLLTGVVVGPHVLGLFAEHHPTMDFLAELGKLLLMFSAGLEVNLSLVLPGTAPINDLWALNHLASPGVRNDCWAVVGVSKVWGYENYPCTRTIDNHILRLRKKLEAQPAHPKHFHTVHGTDYKFLP